MPNLKWIVGPKVREIEQGKVRPRCEHCGISIALNQIAAMVVRGESAQAWCLTCWDAVPAAVEEYRDA